MSLSKYEAISAIAEELNVSFDAAREEWARRKLLEEWSKRGYSPEQITFETELYYDGYFYEERVVAKVKPNV